NVPSQRGYTAARMSKIIYILADNRSGSTLLDQLLGAHPDIVSQGEVHHLAAYVRQDRSLYDPVHPLDCSCGRPVTKCPFWIQVAGEVDRPLETLQLHLRFLNSRKSLGTDRRLSQRILNRAIRRFPGLLRQSKVA